MRDADDVLLDDRAGVELLRRASTTTSQLPLSSSSSSASAAGFVSGVTGT
jgi:hypothetical protein